MNAPMVFKDGALWGVLGTPGGDNQVQVNLQVLVAMLDLGFDPQTAVELPRWTSSQSGQSANFPHDGDGTLTIESDFGEEVLGALERKGHRLKRVGHLEGPCAMQAVRLMPNGVRAAAFRHAPRRLGARLLRGCARRPWTWHALFRPVTIAQDARSRVSLRRKAR